MLQRTLYAIVQISERSCSRDCQKIMEVILFNPILRSQWPDSVGTEFSMSGLEISPTVSQYNALRRKHMIAEEKKKPSVSYANGQVTEYL